MKRFLATMIAIAVALCAAVQPALSQCTINVTDTLRASAVVDVSSTGAYPDDSIDDTQSLQNALDIIDAQGGGLVDITRAGEYMIGDPSTAPVAIEFPTRRWWTQRCALQIGDNTVLRIGPGVVLRMAAGANRSMFCLKKPDPAYRNSNVHIIGQGTIRNDQAQQVDNTGPSFYNGQTFFLFGIDNLEISGLTFDTRGNSNKYAIHFGDVVHATVDRLFGNQLYSDFVHFNGPAEHVYINNIRAISVSGHGDNIIAGIASEGGNLDGPLVTVTGYYPEPTLDADTDPRDFRWIHINDIYTNTAYQPIRLVGRPTDTIRDVIISNVNGNSSNGALIAIGDDGTGAALLVGATMYDITVDTVHGYATAAAGLVQVSGINVKSVVARNLVVSSPTSSAFTFIPANCAYTNGSWTHASLTMTSTGAFTNYRFREGDQIAVTAGTNATKGIYRIARRVSNDAIQLDRTIGASATTNISFSIMSLQSLVLDNVISTPDVGTIGSVINLGASNGGGIGNVAISNSRATLGVGGVFISTGGSNNSIPRLKLSNTETDGLGNSNGVGITIASGSGGSSFIYDEVITQATTGATGRFRYWNGANTIYAVVTSGTFAGANVVTGGTSGATITPPSGASTTYNVSHIRNGAQTIDQDWTFSGITMKNGGYFVQSSNASSLVISYTGWTFDNPGLSSLWQTTAGLLRIQGTGAKCYPAGTSMGQLTSSGTALIQVDDPDYLGTAQKLTPRKGDRVNNVTAVAAPYINGVPAGTGVLRANATQTVGDQWGVSAAPVTFPWGPLYPVHTTATAGVAISSGESGNSYNNSGASGAVPFALPPATVGLTYTFNCVTAQAMHVVPNGIDTIALPSTQAQQTAGYGITTATAGGTMTVKCDKAGQWDTYGGSTATWTAQVNLAVAGPTTLVAGTDKGKIVNVSAATTVTLPAWASGEWYKIVSTGANAVTVKPAAGTDTIFVMSTAARTTNAGGGTVCTAVAGSSIIVKAGSSGQWDVISSKGTWN